MIPIHLTFHQKLVGLVVEYNRLTLDYIFIEYNLRLKISIKVELFRNTTCQCGICTSATSSALCGNRKELAKTSFKVDTVHGAILI